MKQFICTQTHSQQQHNGLTEKGFKGNSAPTKLSKESFECNTRRKFRTLALFLHLDCTLAPFRLLAPFNLGKSCLAQGTGIFTIGPLFNASETKRVLTSINKGNFLWLRFRHADATVGIAFLLLFVLVGIRLSVFQEDVLFRQAASWKQAAFR